MSEFVGRTGSNRVYSYPEPRGGGNPLTIFARNFAKGPGGDTPQDVTVAGVQIQWSSVDVPDTDPEDVPITARSTGVIRVSGVVNVQNVTGNPNNVTVQVQVNDVLVTNSPVSEATVPNGFEGDGFESIPYLVEFGLTPGTKFDVQLFVTAEADSAIKLTVNGSTIDVQEVAVATG